MLRIQRLVWVALFMSVVSLATGAEEFRCETDIFLAAKKEPVQETLTIFTGGIVYDFLLGQAEEITIYDTGRGTISLLDKKRELRTSILTDDLLQFTAAYKTNKAESDLFKFCIQPEFEETFADNTLTLKASQLTYIVKCVKTEQSTAEQLHAQRVRRYAEFADWSARLNGMRPGNLPPFPRMELNDALVRNGILAEEIERTISTTHLTGRRSETIRSRHLFNWGLSMRDRQQIENVGDYLTRYKSVSVEDYLGLSKKMARK